MMGTTHITLMGTTHITLIDTTHITLMGTAHITLMGTTHITLMGTTHITLMGTTHITLMGTTHIILMGTTHFTMMGTTHITGANVTYLPACTPPPRFINCVFEDNEAVYGGAVMVVGNPDAPDLSSEILGRPLPDSNALFDGCTFKYVMSVWVWVGGVGGPECRDPGAAPPRQQRPV